MQLAYAETGGGPAVVLLHGFPLSRAMWAGQVEALGAGYRVITPDLRGHGESAAPDGAYTMDEMADDVVELLDRLGIDQPVVLGGLSMGGYVVLSLVLRHPRRVRGLMLLDTKVAPDTPEAARAREVTARGVLEAGHARTMVEGMVPRLFGKTTLEQNPGLVSAMVADMAKTSPQGVAGALRGMAIRPDRRPDLAKIRVPTLVLVGEEDVISPVSEAKEIASSLPEAQLEVVPAAGHLAPCESPTVASRAILDFLARIQTHPGAAAAT